MAESGFVAVAWNPDDAITVEKLRQMSNNESLLNQRMPLLRLRLLGKDGSRDRAMRVLSGIKLIPPDSSKSNQTETVEFGGFFTAGCVPAITTGIITSHPRLHHRITGINALMPNDRGFKIHVQMDNPNTQDGNNKYDARSYVSYIALGY